MIGGLEGCGNGNGGPQCMGIFMMKREKPRGKLLQRYVIVREVYLTTSRTQEEALAVP